MNSEKNFLNKKNKFPVKIFVAVFIFLFFIIIINLFLLPIKNSFYLLSSPLQKIFWSAGGLSSNFLASILNAGNLSKENQNLKNKIQELQIQVANLHSVIGGNEAQSSVSFACQNDDFKLLMAGVVGLEEKDMFSINKGSADGILEGMPVINQQGALFGKVFKVYKNFSEVMLISNTNSVVAVEIKKDDKEITGVLRGSGNFNVYLDMVLIDEVISEGDILFTSSLEKIFPKNLLIGNITKIHKNDQDPYQKASVQTMLQTSPDNLFVILNHKQK